jgi:hypothetical protein
VKTGDLQGLSGDGGNRTHERFPLSLGDAAPHGKLEPPTKRPRTAQTAGGMAQEAEAPMHAQPTRLVPLRTCTGEIVAHAIVDAQDYGWASKRRWSLSYGYAKYGKRADGKLLHVYLHREVLGIPPGDPARVDHRNTNRLDCRRSNLRLATVAENAQNRRGGNAGSSSRHRGVSWDARKDRWRAQVWLNGKNHHLGEFKDEDEAGRVAAEFRREHMPFSEADRDAA